MLFLLKKSHSIYSFTHTHTHTHIHSHTQIQHLLTSGSPSILSPQIEF